MDFNSFFRKDIENFQLPKEFTICIPPMEPGNNLNIVANFLSIPKVYAGDPFEDYPWDWRSVYVYASDNPAMAKSGEKDIYNKYSSFPYYKSMGEILSGTFNILSNITPGFSWISLIEFMIDFDNIGNNPYESFEINATAAWTRKYIQIWDVYYQKWVTGSCTEYTNWDTYEDLYYYNISENRMIRDTNHEYGTTYATHWNDYAWLIEKAKIGFWYSYIVWDVTGNHKVKYNGNTEITLRENF